MECASVSFSPKKISLPTPSYKVYTALLTQSGASDPQSLDGSGTLTIGVTYQIEGNDSGTTDFTNVGAPNNNEGTYFIATGTIPNSWGVNNDGQLTYNTGAPVVKVLENTIGNIWFTYNNVGQYCINSNILTPINKTTFFVAPLNNQLDYGICTLDANSTDSQILFNTNSITGPFADDLLYNTSIEIRVYNPDPLLLDLYPGAAAAYSLRKLKTSYSGSAIRVRRSTDNAEQDIGFIGENLDTPALIAFCDPDEGFVTTWYDQSGNSKDIVNTVAVGQPQIVGGGVVLLENNKPTMTFDGSNDDLSANFGTILNQPSTMFSVVTPLTLALGTTRHFIDKYSAGDRQAVYMLLSNNIALFSGSSFDSGTAFTTTQQLITTTFNSTNSTIKRNLGSIITGNAGTQNQNGLRIGSNAGVASFFNMNLQEVILYNSDESANSSNINLNINNFYNINL